MTVSASEVAFVAVLVLLACGALRTWLHFDLYRALRERHAADWAEIVGSWAPWSRSIDRFILLRQDADLNDSDISTTVDQIWFVSGLGLAAGVLLFVMSLMYGGRIPWPW